MVRALSETWWFDRLGENLDVPPLEIPDGHNTVTTIREHIRQHLISTPGYPVNGPAIRRRRLGGYDIVDERSHFTYGQARRGPVFSEKPMPILPPMIRPRASANTQDRPTDGSE